MGVRLRQASKRGLIIGKTMADPVIFTSLGLILLASAFAAIVSRDDAGVFLFLFVSFVGVAGLLLMCQAAIPALAVLFAVFIGAGFLLFLWARRNNFDKGVLFLQFRRRSRLLMAAGVFLIAEMIVIIAMESGEGRVSSSALAPTGFPAPDDRTLGQTIVSDYLFTFEIAGMIVLTAILGAFLMLRHPRPSEFEAIRPRFPWGGKRNKGKGGL